MLIARLQRVDASQHLGGVTAGGGRVRQDQADGLLGVDDEDGADGEGDALGVDVGGVLVVDHVVGQGHLALLVANDGEAEAALRNLVDVLDPLGVRLDRVGRQPDQLDVALGELGLELGEGAQLGRAHRREVWWPNASDRLDGGRGTAKDEAETTHLRGERRAHTSCRRSTGGI